jgi:undecaprenyl-diphosphatase
MSEFVQALILALVQGLTEFLPVSSSAHLILPSRLLGWADQGLAFDVAVHVGSLLAVILYFRRDLLALAMGSWSWLLRREEKQQAQMVLWLMLATLPVGLAGVLLDDFVEQKLRSLAVIWDWLIGDGVVCLG